MYHDDKYNVPDREKLHRITDIISVWHSWTAAVPRVNVKQRHNRRMSYSKVANRKTTLLVLSTFISNYR